jgi:hypothetical protein
MTATLLTAVKFREFDANGDPLAGGKVYTYAAGTTTPLATYTDAGGGTPNTNPVILDANGEASVWINAGSEYKFVVKSSADVTLKTVDNISDQGALIAARLADSSNAAYGDALVAVKSVLTGGTARTQHAKNADIVSIKDFGAVMDGVTDDTTAIQAAFDSGASMVYIPNGTAIASTLTITATIAVFGAGTIKQKGSTSGNLVAISGANVSATFDGVTFDCNNGSQSSNSTNKTLLYTAYGTVNTPAVLKINCCTFQGGCLADVTVEAPDDGKYTACVITSSTFTGGNDGVETTYAPRFVDSKGNALTIVDSCHFVYDQSVTTGKAGVVVYKNVETPTYYGRIVISNNFFQNVGRDTADALGPVDLYSYATDSIIIGNTFKDIHGRGLALKSDTRRCIVANNAFYNMITSASACIVVNASTTTTVNGKVIISGNILDTSGGYGIYINGFNSATTGTTNDYLISDNFVSNCTLDAIVLNAIGRATLNNNTCIGFRSGLRFTYCTGPIVVNGGMFNGGSGSTIAANDDDNNPNCDFTFNNVNIENNASNRAFSMSGRDITYAGCDIKGCAAGFYNKTVTGTVTMLANSVRDASTNAFIDGGDVAQYVVRGNYFEGFAPKQLTIASGAISVYDNYHTVATEGGGLTDDLDTINGGYPGMVVTLSDATDAGDVTIKDGTGNLQLAGDFAITTASATITLVYNGTYWREIARSGNG